MNLLDALNRELDRHRTASDPASARAEIVRLFKEQTTRKELSDSPDYLLHPKCWCEACNINLNGWRTRMSVCPDCGDKRCPKALHHDGHCAASCKEPTR